MKKTGVSVAILVLLLMMGVAAGAGSFTFFYANGASYLSNDPKACANCHIMQDQYDSWQKGGHHTFATCNDCHVPHDLVGKYLTKADNGYHHSVAFTFGGFHEPIRMRPQSRAIVEQNCLACHGSFVSAVAQAAGHDSQASDCLRCHQSAGHGPRK
jgi:cytochrome c nitrite reductase small subunit